MSNLSPTAKELMSVNARMRKLRAELARLVPIERELVVTLIDVEKMKMPQVGKLINVPSRQQIFAMYQKGKEQA